VNELGTRTEQVSVVQPVLDVCDNVDDTRKAARLH